MQQSFTLLRRLIILLTCYVLTACGDGTQPFSADSIESKKALGCGTDSDPCVLGGLTTNTPRRPPTCGGSIGVTCEDLQEGGEGTTEGSSGGIVSGPSDGSDAPDDLGADTIIPDCPPTNPTNFQAAYCRSFPPEDERLTRTMKALERIEQRGEECAVIAQTARQLIAQGAFRYFEWVEGDKDGWGHRNTGVLIAVGAVDGWGGDDYVYNRLFDAIIAHEIDHFMGLGHIDAEGKSTPNSQKCGG